jgi:ribonuclease HII
MKTTIAGIDECNKGEALNPIVVVCCYTDTKLEQIPYFLESKSLTKSLKKRIYQQLDSYLRDYKIKYLVKELKPDEILKGKLNEQLLEMQKNLILEVAPKRTYIDSLQKVTPLFLAKYKDLRSEIVLENKLDSTNALVAIASLVAAREKDRNLDKLQKEVLQKVGSGNLRDPVTIKYIQNSYPYVKGLKKHWDLSSIIK